eukprot:1749855-Amphidinium_carterae.1
MNTPITYYHDTIKVSNQYEHDLLRIVQLLGPYCSSLVAVHPTERFEAWVAGRNDALQLWAFVVISSSCQRRSSSNHVEGTEHSLCAIDRNHVPISDTSHGVAAKVQCCSIEVRTAAKTRTSQQLLRP